VRGAGRAEGVANWVGETGDVTSSLWGRREKERGSDWLRRGLRLLGSMVSLEKGSARTSSSGRAGRRAMLCWSPRALGWVGEGGLVMGTVVGFQLGWFSSVRMLVLRQRIWGWSLKVSTGRLISVPGCRGGEVRSVRTRVDACSGTLVSWLELATYRSCTVVDRSTLYPLVLGLPSLMGVSMS